MSSLSQELNKHKTNVINPDPVTMTRLPLLQLLAFTVWTLLCATCAYGFGGEFHGVPRRDGDTSLTLTGNSPWVVNVTAESTAVQMALRDVQRDFYKVNTH